MKTKIANLERELKTHQAMAKAMEKDNTVLARVCIKLNFALIAYVIHIIVLVSSIVVVHLAFLMLKMAGLKCLH